MKILIAEDNIDHLAEAMKVVEAAGHEVVWVMNESDAQGLIRKSIGPTGQSEFDGIITDIFMPHGGVPPWTHANDPCGVAVKLLAEKHCIPCVMCTAGFHHGSRYDWICQIGRQLGWPEIVDASSSYFDESNTKDWTSALDRLVEEIAKKK